MFIELNARIEQTNNHITWRTLKHWHTTVREMRNRLAALVQPILLCVIFVLIVSINFQQHVIISRQKLHIRLNTAMV